MIRKFFFIFAMVLPSLAVADDEPVTVFAAASLRGALDAVADTFDGDVILSYGGSGTMARQVAAGAPADVIVLASPDWMNWLQDRGVAKAEARIDLLGNALVLIAPAASTQNVDPRDVLASLGENRLAIGQREAVPAGTYAREWLEKTGQWNAVEPQLAETDNVRAALALVARGDAPLGLVYRTDALAETDVRVVFEVPEDQHSPIVYPAAWLSEAGLGFMTHLQSPEAQEIFDRFGFTPVTP